MNRRSLFSRVLAALSAAVGLPVISDVRAEKACSDANGAGKTVTWYSCAGGVTRAHTYAPKGGADA